MGVIFHQHSCVSKSPCVDTVIPVSALLYRYNFINIWRAGQVLGVGDQGGCPGHQINIWGRHHIALLFRFDFEAVARLAAQGTLKTFFASGGRPLLQGGEVCSALTLAKVKCR